MNPGEREDSGILWFRSRDEREDYDLDTLRERLQQKEEDR